MVMVQDKTDEIQQRMTILGELDIAAFLPWIHRHAAKLGLSQTVAHADDARIELDLRGPEALIDMMEIGCLLGPIDVWVETIARAPCNAQFPNAKTTV